MAYVLSPNQSRMVQKSISDYAAIDAGAFDAWLEDLYSDIQRQEILPWTMNVPIKALLRSELTRRLDVRVGDSVEGAIADLLHASLEETSDEWTVCWWTPAWAIEAVSRLQPGRRTPEIGPIHEYK
ncbi:hypothetical protein BDZ89DRAFT_1150378 [Hymenopellis radicata]|nr:hypothetical protein BDZ89DRAFT_1150378 [Hymenopellis radicata]